MTDFGPTVRFGNFELDQDAGELRREGAKVRMQEQPLQILQILLTQPGRVVPREELQKHIWPSGTFADFDHGINNAINRHSPYVTARNAGTEYVMATNIALIHAERTIDAVRQQRKLALFLPQNRESFER
jgi:DNA-binding response OmpR family regulator